jgi:CspA family cold shock protein
MATGTIKTLVKDRGFGFIQASGSGEDVFFHRTAVSEGTFDDLIVGQSVEFEAERDPRDPRRNRAVGVRAAG